jgi:selenide,water dikinase
VIYSPNLSKEEQLLLCDAQTSGGLLAAVDAQYVDLMLNEMHSEGVEKAAVIGRIEDGTPGKIFVDRNSDP